MNPFRDLTRIELRVAEALYDSFFGGLASAPRTEAFRAWLSARLASSGFEIACGVRLALFVVLLAPLLLLPGWRTFLRLPPGSRGVLLARLAQVESYAARQLLLMLKALFALFAGHELGARTQLTQLTRRRG